MFTRIFLVFGFPGRNVLENEQSRNVSLNNLHQMIYLKILVTIIVRKVLARWLSITTHHYSPIFGMPQMVCEIRYAGKHYALIYACFLGLFSCISHENDPKIWVYLKTVISGQYLVQLYGQNI